MVRLCLDLNIWCAAWLADRAGRQATAAQSLVQAARTGQSGRGPVQLVISHGMIERLSQVLVAQLDFLPDQAHALTSVLAGYGTFGPSLTLGGVGVIPIHDAEDRHVLETAWAGGADLLATANLRDFLTADATPVIPGRAWRLMRPDHSLVLAHPFEAAGWIRGEGDWPQAGVTGR